MHARAVKFVVLLGIVGAAAATAQGAPRFTSAFPGSGAAVTSYNGSGARSCPSCSG
jgi:hypothetical protein